jgi:hypothetical protein
MSLVANEGAGAGAGPTATPDMRPIPPHFRDTNEWAPLPETEIDRLQKTLSPHLRKMDIPNTKALRVEFVKTLLAKQNHTCAFGKNVGGIYCWNEPKVNYMNGTYMKKPYLKLQWGHITPRCREEDQAFDNLYLLCARCNNHIQSSRRLSQLKAELLSKIEHIDAMISSTTTT